MYIRVTHCVQSLFNVCTYFYNHFLGVFYRLKVKAYFFPYVSMALCNGWYFPLGVLFFSICSMVPYMFDYVGLFTISTSGRLGYQVILQQTRCLGSISFYLPLFSCYCVLRTWPCFSHRSLHLLSSEVPICCEFLCCTMYGVFCCTFYR